MHLRHPVSCYVTHMNVSCRFSLWSGLAHKGIGAQILQHTATQRNTMQHTAAHCSTLQYSIVQYNTVRHTATRCNTLQHYSTL